MRQRPIPLFLLSILALTLIRGAVSLHRHGIHRPVVFRKHAPHSEAAALASAPETLRTPGPKADAALAALADAADEEATVTSGAAARLLGAMATPYPERSAADAGAIQEALRKVLVAHADALPVETLALQANSESAPQRALALRLLASAGTPEAAQTLAYWLRASTRAEDQALVLAALRAVPHHPGVLLPPLLDLLEQGTEADEVELTLVAYGLADRLPRRLLEAHKPTLLARYQAALEGLREHAQADNPATLWEPAALHHLERAERLLGVFGFLPEPWAAPQIQAALAFPDTRVMLGGALALLRQGAVPTPEVAERLAADPVTRDAWLTMLHDVDRLDLCPAPYKTDIARLESALVEWLTFPTELGRPPAAIEFVREVEVAKVEGEGKERYFLYRFKPATDADGPWLAGISGPLLPLGEAAHYAHTMSDQIPLADKTAEQHVQDMVDKLRAYERQRDG